ncbi:MAG: [protein-PII] uridylyltransferase [Thermodesulfovibrionales bacterium]
MNEAILTELSSWVASGRNGLVLTGMYTAKIDRLLQGLFAETSRAAGKEKARKAAREKGLVLIATGGYGRLEMAPYSDVDIMLLAADPSETALVEPLLYKLWDTGLDISHSFRTPEECLEEAFRDIRTRTSLLESRYVAGDRQLFERFRTEVYPEIACRRQKDFVREKLREKGQRHLNSGSSVFLLEPHIKEGDGGLRDIHTAYWLSKVALKTENYIAFFEGVGPACRRRFTDAYEFLLRTRFCLHLASRSKNDVLSFEYQKAVAAMTGFRDSKKFSASERMLRYYYLKSRTIKNITSGIVAACSRPYVELRRDLEIRKINDSFSVSGGSLISTAAGGLSNDPGRIMEAFYHYARTGRRFSSSLRAEITRNLAGINRRTRNSAKAVQYFLEILRGGRVHETLHDMHETGVLGRFIPEFGGLRMLVVHEPYHLYTVDEHTLMAVRKLEDLRTTSYKSLEELHSIINSVQRIDILFLALLLHDIGKAAGRHHEEEGYKRLKNIMERFNLDTKSRLRIEFLVRNHILMSEIALKRETSDLEVISRFSDAVGDPDNLKALYLITYADISAVNPGFWSSWKAYLLRELYLHTLDHLNGVTRNRADYVSGLLANVHGPDGQQLREFIDGMPDRYLLSTTKTKVLHDFRLVRTAQEGGSAVRIDSRSDGLVELSISAPDSAGLFVRLVAAISSRGLNIVNGRIFTGRNGMVIDKIAVSNWQEIWWEGLAQELTSGLQQVIAGQGTLRPPGRGPGTTVSPFDLFIEIDNEGSDEFSLIEVFSPDRLGLLYEISSVLLNNGIDISSARINTESGLAQDIFSVQHGGRKLDYRSSQKVLSELWMTLKEE